MSRHAHVTGVFALFAAFHWTAGARADMKDLLPSHGGKVVELVDFGGSGLRVGEMRVRGGDHDSTTGAVTLDGRREAYAFDRGLVVRHAMDSRIGGGTGRFEGGIGTSISGGYRAPVSEHHGPVVRGGVDASLEGNRYLFYGLLELPKAFVGWQYLGKGRLAEIGATGGYVLVGRYATGFSAERDLTGSLEWGAAATLHLAPVHARVRVTRIEAQSAPFDTIGVDVCAFGHRLLSCAGVQYLSGSVAVPGAAPTTARTWTVGLSFGKARK